jgi:hypothetical protein
VVVRLALAVGVCAAVVGGATWSGSSGGRSAAALDPASLAGSAGSDVSLTSSSAVTVSGSGANSGLKVTVSQTKDLTHQAVSVTWTGGQPTFTDSTGFHGKFGGDYTQIMQCWGDSGPVPAQCEFGAENVTGSYPVAGGFSLAESRIIGLPNIGSDPMGASYTDPTSGLIYSPFNAVDGTSVPETINPAGNPELGIPYDVNPYFDHTTTNEIDYSRTYADGSGQELFELKTGLEAPGLGCGQQSEIHADGSTSTPQCWLVVIPRGTPAQEDFPNDPALVVQQMVNASPLGAIAWANRIVIPLTFSPIGASCGLSATPRHIVGGELASVAIASWQPALCSGPNAPTYNYSVVDDDRARSLLVGSSQGDGMAVVSRPLDPTTVDPNNPVVYAPLTVSGVVIGVNIVRIPAFPNTTHAPVPEEVPFQGKRITHLNLTPRLIAKLLTESYQSEFLNLPGTVSFPGTLPNGYTWLAHNAQTLVSDPEFLQYNPEFTILSPFGNGNEIDASGLVVAQGSSDAAYTLWQWVLADPEAKAWLDGQADPWGMQVNPYYSTTANSANGNVPFNATAPNQFPKSDPYTWNSGQTIAGQPARPLDLQDWSPYVLSMQAAAAATRSTNSGARTSPQSGVTPSTYWGANGPQSIGTYFMLSVTDSANATRFGLQTAALSRAGDDGAGREFVPPTEAGLLAGVNAMTPSAVPSVQQPNPASTMAGAYPLTMLAYAAVMPAGLDASGRQDYAKFVKYAAGAGQTPGTAFGTLPFGYASLPASLVTAANTAAEAILNPPSPPSTTTTTTAPPTTTTTQQVTTMTTIPSSQQTAPAPPVTAAPPSGGTTRLPSTGNPPVGVGPTTTPTVNGGATPSTIKLGPAGSTSTPAVAAGATAPVAVGAERYAIPAALGIGVAAFAGVQLFGRRRRNRTR